jgi:biopolymer transport protein ExbB/TolQ
MAQYRLPYVVQRAESAARLESAKVRRRMKRGLMSLASISATAALSGFLGMVIGLFRSFGSMCGSRSCELARISAAVSEAMVPGILGLVTALAAFCFYHRLSGQLHTFDLEMKSATADMVNRLVIHLQRLRIGESAPRVQT